MYDRVEVKERAKTVLSGYRGPCIGVYVLYTVIVAICGVIIYGLGAFFLLPPLLVGLSCFYLLVWRGLTPGFDRLFAGFDSYTRSLIGILWMELFTFLWSLLFIIPGIIKGLAYAMTPYLIADYGDLDPRRALRVSMAITDGRKAEILVMYLSFIGWELLSAFTFGILAVVHVGPYKQIACAGMYEELLRDALERGVVTEEDLHG